MKLCVVFTPKGNIVAAARIDVESRIPLPRPVATKKLKALDLDVPAEYCHHNLGIVCENLRVDAKRKMLIPIRGKKLAKAPALRSQPT